MPRTAHRPPTHGLMASSKLHRTPIPERLPPAHNSPAGVAAAPARPVWRRMTRAGAAATFVMPALALYAGFVLWPLLRLAELSLSRWDGYGAPAFVGLANYRALLGDPAIGAELRHSLLWLAVTLCVPLVSGLALALLLNRASTRLRTASRVLLLVPLWLPTIVIVVIWRLLYNPLAGPLNNVLRGSGLGVLAGDWLGDPRLALSALLLPACWAGFGLSMLIFEAALSAISPDVIAASQVDGAGAWARLRYISLPGLRGIFPLATVATALCAVPSYDLVRLLTDGGPGYSTTTLALDMYGRAFASGQVGAGSAIACIQLAVGLALTIVGLATVRGQQSLDHDAAPLPTAAPRRAGRGGAAAATALITATVVVIFPVLWLLRQAAGGVRAPGAAAPAIWDAVSGVWATGFGSAILNSGIVSVVVASCTVALAVPAAFALASARRIAGRLTGMILLLLALGLFQPTIVLIIPLFTILKQLGLLNSAAGLALPEIARVIPIGVLLLWASLRSLPADVLAAARVDGAAPHQELWHVALPLARPMVAVVALWAFLSSWNEYLLPTVVLQDEGLQTVPTALGHFIGGVDTEFALLAMGAVLAIAPLLALYLGLYGTTAVGLRHLRRAWQWT